MTVKTKEKKKKSLPLKILDIIITTILIIILIALLVNVILGYAVPGYIPNIFGYQMYTIVTDSMDPYIKVGALVVSKSVKDSQIDKYVRAAEIDAMDISDEEKARMKESEGVETLPFGTIIVFNGDVNNDGEKNEVVTHYFDKIVFEDGKALVKTFPERFKLIDKTDKDGNLVYDKDGKVVQIKEHVDIKSSEEIGTDYDGFTKNKETTPDDIRAIYSSHVTWIGKFLIFLKSAYGIITIIAIAVILIVGSILLKKVDKKNIDEEQEELKEVDTKKTE